MKYLKTYNRKTKDYVYYVTFDEHGSFEIHFLYSPGHTSCEGGTYGLSVYHIEVGLVRGIMRTIPDFFWEFSWCDIDKSLQQFGFEKQVEATKLQAAIYLNDDIQVQ